MNGRLRAGRLAQALVSRGTGPGLTILIYHRVHPTADPMSPDEVDAREFDWQMRCVRDHFNPMPLDRATQLLRDGKLPRGALSVTFDDGYRDNHDVALPILARHGISATFFVATGYLDGGIMFNDVVIESLRRTTLDELDLGGLGLGSYRLDGTAARRAAVSDILPRLKYMPWQARSEAAMRLAEQAKVVLPSDLMMTAAQVKALHCAGMSIGAHTVNHPILASTPDGDAEREIEKSKLALEAMIAAPVTLFAYPNGRPGKDYARSHVEMVRRLGFGAAVSTVAGAASARSDSYQLPRFLPWDKSPLRFVGRLVRNSYNTNVVGA